MSIPLWLKERLGPRVQYREGSLVRSGSPARYHLSADPTFTKTVSAVIALRRRHVPIIEAKASIERLVAERDIAIDLPMLEHAAVFEAELRELGVRATREASSAAAEG